MWFRSVCLAWFAMGALAQTAPSGVETPQPSFRISGTVVHGLTNQPLAHARLSIGHPQSPEIIETVSADENGHFAFQVAKPGKYVLRGQARGFDQQSLDEHNGFSTAVAAGPDKESENIVFRLQPDASLSGFVTDDGNDPVRGAQVMLFHRAVEEGRNSIHLRVQVWTDDQGHYHFSHVPPGTYFVAISARPWYAQPEPQRPTAGGNGESLDVAYPVTYYSGVIDSAGATPVTVRAGENVSADVALTPVPTIHLELTGLPHASGKFPSAFVTQQVFGEVSVNISSQTEVLPTGEVRIAGLSPGQFELNLQSGEETPANWQQPINLSSNSVVEIKPSTATATVSGTVVLDGQPSAGGYVSLRNHATGNSLDAQVDDKGQFQVTGSPVKPGNYEVAIFNVPNSIVGSVFATGATTSGCSVGIPGSGTVQLTVVMSRGLGRIEGTAIRGGKTVAGAMKAVPPAVVPAAARCAAVSV